jgi:hypothetical protein
MNKTPKVNTKNFVTKDNIVSFSQKKEKVKTKAVPAVDQIFHLHRTIGNQAVQRLFKSGTLQARLKIEKPGDKYEQEADRIAEQVTPISESQVQRGIGYPATGTPNLNLLNSYIRILYELNRILLLKLSRSPGLRESIEGGEELYSELIKDPWLRKFIGKWERMKAPNIKHVLYYEADELQRVITLYINLSRKIIASLTTRDVEKSKLKKTKAAYYRLLNKYSSYYTQMANLNILKSKGGKAAWARTCNVTSIAMALEGMGVSTSDFKDDKGDRKKLKDIAKKFDPEKFRDFSDLEALRMPDFLQFVVIYLCLSSEEGDYIKAKRRAAKFVLNSKNFEEIGQMFGITYGKRWVTNWSKINKDPKPISALKQQVMNRIKKYVDKGAQIIVNKPYHFVRLEEINDKGITIDDPATLGKNKFWEWKDVYKKKYFNSYVVLNKS